MSKTHQVATETSQTSADRNFALQAGRNGQLSSYALACGYTQTVEENGIAVRLWQEHGIYHVRAHDHNHNHNFERTPLNHMSKIDQLTIGEARELTRLFADSPITAAIPATDTQLPFEVGKSYFIRTVTYHLTGRVKSIIGGFLVLESAAWIADSGRFSTALRTGELSEVEPVGEAIVNTSAVTDAFAWRHTLPVVQK